MGTVDKALQLLNHFSESRPEIGLSDLARLAGRDKATVLRLLSALERGGMVEQDRKSRLYRLGPAVLRLAHVREATHPVERSARAIVERLAAESGETVHLSHVEGDHLATIAHVEGAAHATRVRIDPSELLPLHSTASGLAVLAFAPEDFVDAALARPLKATSPHTVTAPEAIRKMLPAIRDRGVAVADETYEDEVFGVAAPVFDRSGAVCGAIAVATPVSRVTDAGRERAAAAVRAAAVDVTRAYGGEPPEAVMGTAA